MLGTRLPGPGAIYLAQTLSFRAPVKIGDTVTRHRGRTDAGKIPCAPDLRVKVCRQVMLDGEALVKVPREEKGKRPIMRL